MSAVFLIDHIVIRVDELAQAIADFTALGFTVTAGGEHPGLGSRNALIAFDDGSYLELIAFPPPRRVLPRFVRARELAADTTTAMERHILPWETAPEGLVDFALLPSSVDDAIAGAHARGLVLAGPIPGGRRRPDGQSVFWQLAVPESPEMPFLCADVTPRSLRVPGGSARVHVNGAVGIQEAIVVVASLDESLARFRALLGAELLRSSDRDSAFVVLGNTTLTVVEPQDGTQMRRHVIQWGEGIFALRLGITNAGYTGPIDNTLAHGARITLSVS